MYGPLLYLHTPLISHGSIGKFRHVPSDYGHAEVLSPRSIASIGSIHTARPSAWVRVIASISLAFGAYDSPLQLHPYSSLLMKGMSLRNSIIPLIMGHVSDTNETMGLTINC